MDQKKLFILDNQPIFGLKVHTTCTQLKKELEILLEFDTIRSPKLTKMTKQQSINYTLLPCSWILDLDYGQKYFAILV